MYPDLAEILINLCLNLLNAAVRNIFNVKRDLTLVRTHRPIWVSALQTWCKVVAAE